MTFRRFVGKRFRGWVHSQFHPPSQLLDYPERAGELPGAQALLRCDGREIFRVWLEFAGETQPCFTHYFKNSSFSRSLRHNYAVHSWRLSQQLLKKGIGTLEVLAALRRRGEWLNWHSLVVAREIPSVYEMPSSGRHLFQVHPILDLDDRVASSLAQELADFHRQGFFHGDLKARHILVHVHRNPRLQFYFVDLEKSHYWPRFPGFLRDILAARDLIQLFSSLGLPRDSPQDLREIFLEEYIQAARLPVWRRRWLLRILDLYRGDRGFRQGQTLLAGLWRKVTGG